MRLSICIVPPYAGPAVFRPARRFPADRARKFVHISASKSIELFGRRSSGQSRNTSRLFYEHGEPADLFIEVWTTFDSEPYPFRVFMDVEVLRVEPGLINPAINF